MPLKTSELEYKVLSILEDNIWTCTEQQMLALQYTVTLNDQERSQSNDIRSKIVQGKVSMRSQWSALCFHVQLWVQIQPVGLAAASASDRAKLLPIHAAQRVISWILLRLQLKDLNWSWGRTQREKLSSPLSVVETAHFQSLSLKNFFFPFDQDKTITLTAPERVLPTHGGLCHETISSIWSRHTATERQRGRATSFLLHSLCSWACTDSLANLFFCLYEYLCLYVIFPATTKTNSRYLANSVLILISKSNFGSEFVALRSTGTSHRGESGGLVFLAAAQQCCDRFSRPPWQPELPCRQPR